MLMWGMRTSTVWGKRVVLGMREAGRITTVWGNRTRGKHQSISVLHAMYTGAGGIERPTSNAR